MKRIRESVLILMADDDLDDRMLTQDALKESRLANELRFVHDGEELMDYLHRRGSYSDPRDSPRPGLILLDLNMPKKDGREALREIKSNPLFRQIPVVVLTTSKAEEDIYRTYDLGANSYITKPVTFEGLVEVMRALGQYWFEIVVLPPGQRGLVMADAPVRVLLVEDDADDFVLTRDLLADVEGTRYTVDWVATYDAALGALARSEHDVGLLDYRLGERDGLELLREAIQRGVRAPLILLTGQGDRAVDVEAMRTGAADFLNKGRLDAALLERSIRYAIERKQTEEALRRLHEELERRVEERTAQLAQTNVVLQAEIRERQRAEEQIKASLKEKEVLLREIHHRVKNNLQVITTLLNLQSKTIKDEQARELLKESQNRVRSMALIHEKLYRARDLARVDFTEYVRNLAAHLLRSYAVDARGLDLQITVDNVFLGVDTAIPCGLIINELVCNALRHAFPGERTGHIHIDLRSGPEKGSDPLNSKGSDPFSGPGKDNRYVLTVRDDGVGFPRDLDFQNTESLGLQIVTALTRQLEGTIELEKGTGTVSAAPAAAGAAETVPVPFSGGTTFTITFTELKYKERG